MINGKKVLSVVTARGGSKGVPRKNERHLKGIPLVNWSVNQSLKSKYIDFTTVSSNCISIRMLTEYAKTDKQYAFIDRPEEFSTDTSPNEEALIHAYYHVKDEFDFDAEIIVNLQPTSPIRNDALIDKCLEKLDNHDSLLTVKKCTPFYLYKEGDEFKAFERSKLINRPMRQELEDDDFFYFDCGNLYVMTREVLLESGSRLGPNLTAFIVDDKQAVQIDTEIDFQLMDFLIRDIGNNI